MARFDQKHQKSSYKVTCSCPTTQFILFEDKSEPFTPNSLYTVF